MDGNMRRKKRDGEFRKLVGRGLGAIGHNRTRAGRASDGARKEMHRVSTGAWLVGRSGAAVAGFFGGKTRE